jgi:hypothetical protein
VERVSDQLTFYKKIYTLEKDVVVLKQAFLAEVTLSLGRAEITERGDQHWVS